MKLSTSFTSSRAGLISIIFIYLITILTILFFSTQIMVNMTGDELPSKTIFIPVMAAISVFLLGIIIVNLVSLINSRRKKLPGSSYKIRLVLFFVLVAVVSSVPQVLLSVNFIDSAMSSWFGKGHSKALKGGIDITLAFYNDRIKSLSAAAESGFFGYAMNGFSSAPEKTWKTVKSSFPFISSFQVFDGKNEIFRAGEEIGMVEFEDIQSSSDGLLSKSVSEGVSVIRAHREYASGRKKYDIFIASIMPEKFDENSEQLTSSFDIFYQLESYQALIRYFLLFVFMFFFLPVFLLAIIISFKLANEIIRPVVYLENATKRVAAGDYSFRLLVRKDDDLAVLMEAFNRMVKELEISRTKLMQTDKISAWQDIARRMAHEIRNPLTPIQLSAERILKKYKQQDEKFGDILESSISIVISEVQRLNNLLKEFGDFAKMPPLVLKKERIADILENVISLFRSSTPNVKIITDGVDRSIELMIDKEKIIRVFTNLFTNAFDAMNYSGKIEITADRLEKEGKQYCRIGMSDTGKGIDPGNYDQIFNPYFTTRREGTGLGLAIVERIIFDHQGSIWFESEKGVGTTFFIDLPEGE